MGGEDQESLHKFSGVASVAKQIEHMCANTVKVANKRSFSWAVNMKPQK